MQPAVALHMTSEGTSVSKGRKIASWVMTGLVTIFLAFDITIKFLKPPAVAEAFQQSGWPLELSVTIGAILLACTVLHLIPRTTVLGAILLTGYLGGAVATNLRLENPLLTHTLFPVYFGVLIWVALWLREPRLKTVFPLMNSGRN